MTARRSSKATDEVTDEVTDETPELAGNEATEAADGPEVVKVVQRPGGLEAVYERHPDGRVERTVRKAEPSAADEPGADEAPADPAED
jgi:hypothetical protein